MFIDEATSVSPTCGKRQEVKAPGFCEAKIPWPAPQRHRFTLPMPIPLNPEALYITVRGRRILFDKAKPVRYLLGSYYQVIRGRT
jgi:hypothetical protein